MTNALIEHQDRMGKFLESLPARVIAHATFPRPVIEQERDGVLREWISRVQQQLRTTVGYVVGLERYPSRHLHVVLFANRPLSLLHVEGAFRRVANHHHQAAVIAEPYQLGSGGLSYVMKSEDRDQCDVSFSRNLDCFANGGRLHRGRRTTARERRQARRIAAQAGPGNQQK